MTGAPGPAERRAILETILRSVLRRPDLAVHRGLSASDVPGWDSVRMVDIILDLEDALGIRIPASRMGGLRNVGDLQDLVETLATPQA